MTSLIVSLLFLPPLVWADEDKAPEVIEIEEISVTATRTERKTQEVPASVTVINEEDLEKTRMFNLKEALAGIPGVLIDTKNQGYDSRLIIRGAGLKARYGVRDIMVLLNGVPITDPDSFTRLDFIDTQLIENIEVVKGPSTLWGANAAGGVISITSRSPFQREGGVVKLGLGDSQTRNYHLSYSKNLNGNLFLTAGGSRRESDNSWRRWNRFYTNQVSFEPALITDDGTIWENHFSYTKAFLNLPGKLDQSMFETYERTGEAMETEGPWQFSGRYSEIFFFNSRLSREVGDWEFKPLVFVNNWTHHHPVTGRINDADTYVIGTDIQVDRRHRFGLLNGTLTAGITARLDNQKTDYYEYADYLATSSGRITQVLSDTVGDLLEKQSRESFLGGIYTQESLQFGRWILDMGARLDRITMEISGTAWGEYSWSRGKYIDYASPRDYIINKSYTAVSPRCGISYKLTEMLNLYGTISSGVQTPTEGEMTENPDLGLVRVKNYELGLKARHNRWTFDTSLYYSPVTNEIVSVIQDGNTEYVNAGKTLKKGFEFSGAFTLVDGLKLGASYTYSDYRFDEFTEPVRTGSTTVNVDRSGNQVPYIPRHQYTLFADYQHPCGLKFRIQTHTWGTYYMDNGNTEEYGGYDFLTHIMAGYEKGNIEVALNVDNLFDQRYAVEAQKDTSGTKTYVPASPRSFMVRVTYKF